MGQQAPAITNLRYYQNRTKTGAPTASKVAQGVMYYGYGVQRLDQEADEQLQLRGTWYTPENDAVSHKDVRQWSGDNALENKYTYTAVLSARDGWMQAEDFNQVMEKAGVFTDWRLIVHTDTEHVHAHVIAFREKTLVKAEFNAWRKEARSELEKLEQQRLQQEAEQEQARAQTLQAGAQEENSQLNQGWDIGY